MSRLVIFSGLIQVLVCIIAVGGLLLVRFVLVSPNGSSYYTSVVLVVAFIGCGVNRAMMMTLFVIILFIILILY